MGLPVGETYFSPARVVVTNSRGDFAFNVGSSAGDGVWTNTTTGQTRLVAIEGALPNDPTMRIDPRYEQLFVTDGGATYFKADVEHQGTEGQGVFRETFAGGLETVITSGSDYQGLPAGSRIDEIYLLNASRGGPFLVNAWVRDDATDNFLYDVVLQGEVGEPLTEISRSGDTPMGLATGESLTRANAYYSAQVNANGNALIPVDITGPAVDDSNDFALVKHTDEGSKVVLRQGQRFSRSTLTNILEFQLTDQDDLFFNASLNGSSDYSLYKLSESDVLTPVLNSATPIQGLPAGVTAQGGSFQVNNLGDALVATRLQGAGVNDDNNDALVKIDSSGAQLVVREGQLADGFAAANYGTFPIGFTFSNMDITDQGDIFFSAILEDGGLGEVNANNNMAFWHLSPSGVQTMLLRDFDPLPFPGIADYVGNPRVKIPDLNSQASGYSNGGFAAFETFWGSQLVPARNIPEPPGLTVMVLGTLVLGGTLCRRQRWAAVS